MDETWRISCARVYNARKEMMSEAIDKIRDYILNSILADPEGAALNVPHYLIRENVEFRIDASDDDDFVRIEGWITYGTLKGLSKGQMTKAEAYEILNTNDWHIDKRGLTCDRWVQVLEAIRIATETLGREL